MGTYGDDNKPAPVQHLVDTYGGELVGVSARNGGLWMVRQGDVVLHGDRVQSPTTKNGGLVRLRLTLGKSAWAKPSGNVRSRSIEVSARSEDNGLGNIQRAAKQALIDAGFTGSSLYDDFVAAAGEEESRVIRSDNR